MFTSSRTVVAVRCGHYLHKACFDALMQTSFKCPICNRSAVNMELQWRKLDHAIGAQPMPSQFRTTRAYISCNDCMARSTTDFHWLGNKCTMCDSYNTNQIKMINSPSEQELQAVRESQEILALREAERELRTRDAAGIAAEEEARGSGDIDDQAPLAAEVHEPSSLPAERQTRRLDHPNPHTVRSDGYFIQEASNNEAAPSASDNVDVDMVDAICTATEDDRETTPDDVAFWGEEISPMAWNMPSVSQVNLPRVPRPSMPALPEGWPRLPSINIPSVAMPRAVSPSAIWAAGSPSISGWNMPSPSFFAARRRAAESVATAAANADGGVTLAEQPGEGTRRLEEDSESSASDFEEENMETDLDEDGDVDEMALFGHR